MNKYYFSPYLIKILLIVGSYVYIETSSPRQYGDNAKLEFSVSSPDIGKLSCLKFYYHMYGDTINTLNVYNGITKVFTKSGNQGNEWLNAKLTMSLQTTVSYIYFHNYLHDQIIKCQHTNKFTMNKKGTVKLFLIATGEFQKCKPK